VVSFIGGLGGREVDAEAFGYMIDRSNELVTEDSDVLYEPLAVRGMAIGTGVRG